MKICTIVLIETLWNVKIYDVSGVPGIFCVLIETLWNVKRNITHIILTSSGINRNIVECKELSVSFYAQHCLVLIETLWNVKWHLVTQNWNQTQY